METMNPVRICIPRVPIVLIVAFVVGCCCLALGQHSHRSEQSHFSAEDEAVNKPAPIPADVMAILRNDKTVRGALEDQKIEPEKIPPSWFSASQIHLSATSRTDLIVVGQPPVTGGNVTIFLVFRATLHGHELIMDAAPAHDLEVKNERWNGLRNIELASTSAVQYSSVLCRFDGKKYAVYRRKSAPTGK